MFVCMNTKRQNEILELLKTTGFVSVDQLVAQFEVTPQSIRRDLGVLNQQRLVIRTHGGAKLASRVENMNYEARKLLAQEQKTAIGESVAELIPNSASLFINIGTTTDSVAQALLQHEQLLVITNNINVASVLRPSPKNKVIITSGEVRSSDGGILGESTVEFIGQFKVDFAIIGVSAIDDTGSLLDFDYREVKVAQAIIENANHVILAADSQKHGKTAPVRIGHLSQIQSFVTDRIPNTKFGELLNSFDIRTIETSIR